MRDRKARRGESAFVVEGPRAIETFLACASDDGVEAVFTDDIERFERGIGVGASAPVHLVERQLLDRICDSETPQGVVAIAKMTSASLAVLEGVTLAVVLDGVQDPGNVGAIVRVAVAMGAQCVICVRGCADPFSPKAVRASAGTVGAVSIVTDVDTAAVIDASEDLGLTRVGATMSGGVDPADFELERRRLQSDPVVTRGGVDPADFELERRRLQSDPVVLFLGGEGTGLSQPLLDVLDTRITIQMAAPVESLNVAVTAGIVLHGLRRVLGAT